MNTKFLISLNQLNLPVIGYYIGYKLSDVITKKMKDKTLTQPKSEEKKSQ